MHRQLIACAKVRAAVARGKQDATGLVPPELWHAPRYTRGGEIDIERAAPSD